jgi:hypothetical protein
MYSFRNYLFGILSMEISETQFLEELGIQSSNWKNRKSRNKHNGKNTSKNCKCT